MMKKVLVIGASGELGGVEKFILTYCQNLISDELKFDFLISAKRCALEDEFMKIGKIFSITISHKRHPIKFKNELKRIIDSNNYDGIWLNDCSLNSIHYLKIAKKCGIKTRIIHSHNSKNMDNSLKGIIRYLIHCKNKLCIKNVATDFWACSVPAAKFFYSNLIKNKNIKIINNAVDVEKFKFSTDIRQQYRKKMNLEDKYVIGHVGRFHFQKNHEFIINICKRLFEIEKNAVLLLVGNGENFEQIKNLTKKMKIEDKVIFLGLRNDVDKIMQAMDIFILPSRFEGLPIVGIEAQTSGLPCLFSDNITKELGIAENVEFLSIEDIQTWVDGLKKYSKIEIDREKAKENITEKGFNISKQIIELRAYFDKL